MAETIGLASGLLTLVIFTHNCCVTLYKTVQSFKSHPQRVLYLLQELDALNAVLESLADTVKSITDVDLSALETPILRCGKACEEFTGELLKCCSRSGSDHTSFRDWAKLRYLGDDIDGFRNTLASYKSTITIALTDATLRRGSVTTERLAEYRELIDTATSELEAHLSTIDEKIEDMAKRTATEAEKTDLERINEERLSTQKCLLIVSELSKHIDEVKPLSGEDASHEDGLLPERATRDTLEDFQTSLSKTAELLEGHMQTLLDRVLAKSSPGMTQGERAEMATLRDNWTTVRQCRDICSKADQRLKESTSFIDNHVTGDENVQFLMSNSEKTIRGTNWGYGNKNRQVGGHYSDESIQKISGDFSIVSIESTVKSTVKEEVSQGNEQPPNAEMGNGGGSAWHAQYGNGRKL